MNRVGLFVKTMIAATCIAMSQMSMASQSQPYTKKDIHQMIITEALKSQRVRPELALAVARVESGFNAEAVSPKGAIGVMQIMPKTAASVFGVERSRLFDAQLNIRLGVQFLDSLLHRYRGREDLALSHYNGGSKVGKWPDSRVIPYTRSYVSKVLRLADDNEIRIAANNISRSKFVTQTKAGRYSAIDVAFSELENSLSNLNRIRQSN